MPSSLAKVSSPSTDYEFGPFRLDMHRRRILRDGRAVSWRSQRQFDLLRVLIEAEPDVVAYDELKVRVWGGKEVLPQTIKQTIKNLRGHLGAYDDCVRNQPGEGYYFNRPPSAVVGHSNLPLEIRTLLKVATEEWNRRTGASLLRGLKLFRQAVELDPNCVEGLLGVAACITMGCHVGFAVVPREELQEARNASDKALSLATGNRQTATTLCQIAQLRIMYDWNFDEAERLLKKAMSLDDTLASAYQFFSHLYLITDRWDRATDAIMKARNLAEGSPMLQSTAGLLLYFMRRHKESIAIGETAIGVSSRVCTGPRYARAALRSRRSI